jgi:hypothetical protein
MSRLPLRTIADVPDDSKGEPTAAEKTNGFPPNLTRILGDAPVAVATYLTVSGINAAFAALTALPAMPKSIITAHRLIDGVAV